MRKKAAYSVIIVVFTVLLSVSTIWFQPVRPVSSQIIATFPIITLPPMATATRTPTPVSIGNFVWDDLDSDGIQDAGEPGLPGITVQLWNPGKNQMFTSTITDANGNYHVISPGPGQFRIRAILPNVLAAFSPKDQGSDNSKDSDVNPTGADFGFSDIFDLASNVISTTLFDIGVLLYRAPTPTRTPSPVSLGNFVWHDLNQNGLQDAGEPGIPGITVQLWNSLKSQMITSTITNASGNFTLIAPMYGDYRIRVVMPTIGSAFSPKDQGSDTQDSDINPSGVDLGFTDIISIASNVISTTSLDAGLRVVGVLPTPTPTPPPPTSLTNRIFLPFILR